MYPKGITDIIRVNPTLNRKTLLKRALVLSLRKIGRSFIVENKEQEDKLINPIYWKVGKRAKKEKEVN